MEKVSTFIGIIILTSAWQTLTCFGCDVGFWGDFCDKQCPSNCATCTHDSVDSGRPCTSCVPGQYSGRWRDYSWRSYYDDCRHDCRYSCVSCASFDNCTECVDGWYGKDCQYLCYSRCKDGVCDKMDGKCTCKTGFTSRFCKDQPSCTNIPCACCKYNKCETNNGSYCTYGCIHGVQGDTCDNECLPDCDTCTQDSRDRLPCTSCVSGKYSGRWEDYSDAPYYDDCRIDCRDSCVSCASYNNCTECVDGRYGPYCEYLCYSGCEGGVCDIDGKCTCKTGHTSRWCYSCIDGYWGKTCDKQCPGQCVTCTQYSKDRGLPCTSCVPGQYSGRQLVVSDVPYYDDCRHRCVRNCVSCTSWLQCTECVDGQYGPFCLFTCSTGCKGGKCNITDASCSCVDGRYDTYCNKSCSTGCEGVCSKTDGSCSCVNGRFGTRCDNYCKNGCIGGTCDKMNGSCSCKSGLIGVDCDQCALNTYDLYPNCTACPDKCLTCISPSECSKCKPGYDINTNCRECLLNKYGPNCSSDCNNNCLNKVKLSKCYGHNGTCVVGCQEGFYGDKCDLSCHKNCKRFKCSRVNGICSHGCQEGFIIFKSDCVPAMSNDDGDFPVATLLGVIGGVVVVVFIIAGFVVFLAKRRNHRPHCCSTTTHDVTQGPGEIQLVAIIAGDNETCDVHIGGSIYYNTKKVLGSGSFGVVYEGRSGLHKNKPVAVKKVECLSDEDAKELLNINKEIKALETLDTTAENTHIIHFIDSYIYKNTVYLAFELAIGTVVDYVSPSNASWRMSLTSENVIRGIVSGLRYTHKRNIIHRDLKPENIFIVNHSVSGRKAVIGDFGQAKVMTGNTLTSKTGNTGSFGFIAPEIWKAMSDTETLSLGTKCNKASDTFSLGLVAYYVISLGKHPFGHKMTAQVSISKGNLPTFDNISLAYEDMLEGMLKHNPADRPSMEVVSEHPALWTSDKIIKYFLQKSDEFESQIKTGTLNDQLLEDPSLITEPCGIWMNLLPVNLKTYLRNYRLNSKSPALYKGKKSSIRYFLRAIRNTTAHYKTDYPKNTHVELGTFPDGHVQLWLTVCPKLLMHVYTKLGPP